MRSQQGGTVLRHSPDVEFYKIVQLQRFLAIGHEILLKRFLDKRVSVSQTVCARNSVLDTDEDRCAINRIFSQYTAPQIPIAHSRRRNVRIEQTNVLQDRARHQKARIAQKIEEPQIFVRDLFLPIEVLFAGAVEPPDVAVND